MCRVDFPPLTIKCASDLVASLRKDGLNVDNALLILSVTGSSIQTIGNLDFFKRPNIFASENSAVRSSEEILNDIEQIISESETTSIGSASAFDAAERNSRSKLAEYLLELLLSYIFG